MNFKSNLRHKSLDDFISKHLKNIFAEGELSKDVVVSRLEITTNPTNPPFKV